MPDYLESTTLDSLAFLCAEVMARREIFLLESEHIAAKPIPVETHVRAIHRRISTRKRMMFSELLEAAPTLQLRVVNFLAILELYKRGMVSPTFASTISKAAASLSSQNLMRSSGRNGRARGNAIARYFWSN